MTEYPQYALSPDSLCRAARTICLTACFLFTAATSASAQVADTTTLSTVVVSATKTPAPRNATTQSVTVISGDDLRARGVARVSDALREVPGASLVQNGSVGSVSTLFMRGGESRYTKFLIDGVAVNAPGGFFDLSHLTTDNIDRIEIVRGPAGVVYGADAVSGVVQIFTRRGQGPAVAGANLRAGTHRTIDGGVDISGSAGTSRYSAAAAQHSTRGIAPFNNQYSNGTLSASASVAPWTRGTVAATARYTAAEFHYPTDFTGALVDSNAYRVQHRLTVGVDGSAKISNAVTGRVVLGSNEVSDLTEDIQNAFGIPENPPARIQSAFRSRNYRRSAEGGLIFQLPGSTSLNVGVEYMREREASGDEAGPVGGPLVPGIEFLARRSNRAAYAELLGGISPGLSYVASVRRDDNSDYDAVSTYRVGGSIAVASATRLRGSLSTAFSAPAFNQLLPTLYTIGSPDLNPERTRSYEIGFEQSAFGGALRMTANYFNQRFNDLIQYVNGGPPRFLGSYANLAAAESNGYDVELAIAPESALSLTAAYTHASPRVAALSPGYAGDLKVGEALIRRPNRTGTAVARYARAGVGSLSATATHVGRRPDVDFSQFPSPTVTLPAYTRLDAAGSIDVFRRREFTVLSLTMRIENLLDTDYEDVLNFATPGRIVLLGARYSGRL